MTAPAAFVRDSKRVALLMKFFGVALVVVSPAMLGRALPGMFTQFRLLMACFGVVYILAALPLNLLMGYAGQVSLGHAAFLGVGAFAAGKLAGERGLPFLIALLASLVLGAFTAVIIGLPALRLRGLYLTLVTLGFGLAAYELVFLNPTFTNASAGVVVPRPRVGTFTFRNNADLLSLLCLVLIVVWSLDRNVVRTKIGRAFFALREREDVAASFGVNVALFKMLAFLLYGALAALAGAMFGAVVGVAQAESFTFEFSLVFVIVVVIGGMGSRLGVAVVAFALGCLLRLFVFLKGWDLVLGPVALGFTLVRHPKGLGHALEKFRRRVDRVIERIPGDTHQTTEGPADPATFVLPRGSATRPTQDASVEVIDLSVRFGGLRAVDQVNLRVHPGSITGLIGPNGAGKTSLFNCISGHLRPACGQIRFRGRDITHEPPHRRAEFGIGRTFQLGGLVPQLSVIDNLLLAQHISATYGPGRALTFLPSVAKQERLLRERSAEVLSGAGLQDVRDRPLEELSHGQQRIVELACVLLAQPALLMLDEPTAGMSPRAAEALAHRLVHLRSDLSQTILLIEHHLPFVLATCDTIYVMDAGKLIFHGPPDQLRQNRAVAEAYLGGSA